MSNEYRRPLWLCGFLLLTCVVVAAYSVQRLGGFEIALHALFTPLSHSSISQLVFSQNWWPRLAVALLTGAGLALVGEMLQLLLRNIFASDTTLGISSGASLALILVTLYIPSLLVIGTEWIAMFGALLMLLLLLGLAKRYQLNPMILIVAGMTLNLIFSGFSLLLLMLNHEKLSGLLVWGAGSLAQQGWDDAQAICVRVILVLFLLLCIRRPLSLMMLGDQTLKGLGVSVSLVRAYALSITVFLAGSLVSYVGVIGFIGLVAPNLMRLAGLEQGLRRWPFSLLVGATLLTIADLLVQGLSDFSQIFVPTGSVTALIGVPILVWLLIRFPIHRAGMTTLSVGAVKVPVRVQKLFWPLSLFLIVSLSVAIFVGRGALGWEWRSLYAESFWLWRLPRTVAAGCAGVLLAWAGTLLQRLTGNAMASPELLGVSSASAMALMLGVFLLETPTYAALGILGLLGALLAFLVLWLLGRKTHFSASTVLLTGIALGSLYEALRSLLLAGGDPRGQQMTAWLAGSTYYVNQQTSMALLVMTGLCLPLVLCFSRWLDVFMLGSKVAQALGVAVNTARLILLMLIAVLCALATLVVGPLSFAGLIAPHMARFLGFTRSFDLLMASGLIGGCIMIWADWIGRQIIFPYEVPAGVLASVLGGTYFIWHLWRRKV